MVKVSLPELKNKAYEKIIEALLKSMRFISPVFFLY